MMFPNLKTRLNIIVEIIRGKTTIKVNEAETWVIRITVANFSHNEINNIIVKNNILNNETTVEDYLVNEGNLDDKKTRQTIWRIKTVAPDTTAVFDITLYGAFLIPGYTFLDSGVATADGIDSIHFNDAGIYVEESSRIPTRGMDLFASY
ncbi:hypothetical protein [Oceanirhabdus seepicola]|uniref:Uncharacterized protein n=1 Tax=Oceanirhabdus seepicola TaxID=2828781 RepID=A0A9J6NZ07_9CLOT|nr:hypothetical protein [Oceanirhabdus seepicola]MCM1989292.1 hypothetical protein [Oceanirhabdus seepicola]